MRISSSMVALLVLSSLALAQPTTTPTTAPTKPRLGVRLFPSDERGALIAEVMVGFAAESAGFQPGDRVIRIGDVETPDLDAFRAAVSKLTDGATAPFTVKRGDLEQVIIVKMTPPRDDAPGAKPPTMPQLREELLAMVEKDQAPRKVLMQGKPAAEAEQKLLEEMKRTDAANRERLKQMIAEHGYPTITMVGDQGAGAAFLIVQHADRDSQWQTSMLPLLESLAKKGEASKGDVAYLTDRILRAQNKPQRYATQYYQEPGPDGKPQFVAPVVEDPANIDQRRLSMGLGPWAQYEAQMARMQQRDPFPAPRGPGDK